MIQILNYSQKYQTNSARNQPFAEFTCRFPVALINMNGNHDQ